MELALLSNLDIVKFVDVSGVIPALLIAILTYICIRLTKRFLDGFAEANTRYRLLSKQLSVLLQFIILFVGGFLHVSKLLRCISRWDVIVYWFGSIWSVMGIKRFVCVIDGRAYTTC